MKGKQMGGGRLRRRGPIGATVRTAVAAAVAAAACTAMIWTCCGCSPQKGQTAGEASSVAVKVVEAEERSGSGTAEPDPIDASKIEGIEATSLSEGEVRELGPYLAHRLYKGEPLEGSDLSIEEVRGFGDGSKRVFNVTVKPTGDAFTLAIGESWSLDEGKTVAPEADPALASGAQLAESQSSYSSKQTAFDERRAWPLSMRDKVDPLIGEAVSSRLAGDVNEYLKEGGLQVGKEADLMVSEDGIVRSGSVVEFDVMALVGVDRVVMKCKYDTETLRHVIVWQP